MELEISLHNDNSAYVLCNGTLSHTFDISPLLVPGNVELAPKLLQSELQSYGQALYNALFPAGSPACIALEARAKRMLLVADEVLDAIPWEYLYGPNGFLVLDLMVVRGLPPINRIPPSNVDMGLHVVAVPSNPLDPSIPQLNIEGEWQRLGESFASLEYSVLLERTRPATLDQLRRKVAGQQQRVVHFMGHGSERDGEAVLFFEAEDGGAIQVTARALAQRLRGTVFLVTLNACVSAVPGATPFRNLARLLAEHSTPYVLGMRFNIADEDARAFARSFYDELARGVPVEEALRQARLILAGSRQPWAVGVPVLYTALTTPGPGFRSQIGPPQVLDHQPPIELSVLPQAEGGFEGRAQELRTLGAMLTGDERPPVITIHGFGGQGKTVLAREAGKRFAWAWPGGIWAGSLEQLPSRARVLLELAHFLGLPASDDPAYLERQVVARLDQQRTLLIFDNAETLCSAVERGDEEALRLTELLKMRLGGTKATLLMTSRTVLGWPGEKLLEIGGLDVGAGARVFRLAAPRRQRDASGPSAAKLSLQIDGHPLSLRLLGAAFDVSQLSLDEFLDVLQATLVSSEDRYRMADHRQRSLYASIDISVRYLSSELRNLLSGLWVFQAPFLPIAAVAVLCGEQLLKLDDPSPLTEQLHELWLRGLLSREQHVLGDEELLLYRLPPVVRPYAEQILTQVHDRTELLTRFGSVYLTTVQQIYQQLKGSPFYALLAKRLYNDLEAAIEHVSGEAQTLYHLCWGWVVNWLGDRQHGQELTELALEAFQVEGEEELELTALTNLGLMQHSVGRVQSSLGIFSQILPRMEYSGDKAGEAATRTNLAGVYYGLGRWDQAKNLLEQALPLHRAASDRSGEATTLNNIGLLDQHFGRFRQAWENLSQALAIRRSIGDQAGEAVTLNNLALVASYIGQHKTALQLLTDALQLRRAIGDRTGEIVSLVNKALTHQELDQLELACELFDEAVELLKNLDDPATLATTQNSQALVYLKLGKGAEARALFTEAAKISQNLGNPAAEAVVLLGLGHLYQTTSEAEQALTCFEKARTLYCTVGDRAGESVAIMGIGRLAELSGDIERARDLYGEALTLQRKAGSPLHLALLLTKLGQFERKANNLMVAFYHCREALDLQRSIGDHTGCATTLCELATIHNLLGQVNLALQRCEEARQLRHESADLMGEAQVLSQMAEICAEAGMAQRRIALLEQALPLLRAANDRRNECHLMQGLGTLYLQNRRKDDARRITEASLLLARQIGARDLELSALSGVASLRLADGRRAEAIQMLDETLSLFAATGLSSDAFGQTPEQIQQLLYILHRR